MVWYLSLSSYLSLAVMKEDRAWPKMSTFKIARYAIYDDAIIAVGISTNCNDINNNYNMIKAKRTQRASDEKWSRLEVARKGLRTGNVTDGRCVLFKMLTVSC